MELKTRRTLFYFFILIFVLVGAYLLIAAQGWVLDLNNLKIVKTGGLFLKYEPTDASVEVNGKIKDVSQGVITSGAFISRLAPGEYRIKLEKPGYLPWEKKLVVGSAVVTSASQIRLWPEKWPLKEVATSSISDFWLTGSGAILKLKDDSLHLDGYILRGRNVILSDSNSNFIITGDGKNYFLTDLENPKAATNIADLLDPIIPQNYFIHPFNGNKILITTADALYSLEPKRPKLEKLTDVKGIMNAALSSSEIFLEDAKGDLMIFNFLLQTTTVYKLNLPETARIEASPDGSLVFFFGNDGALSTFDRSSKELASSTEKISNLFISPDEKRMALIFKDGSVPLLALEDYYADGNVRKGDKWNISSGNGNIGGLEWLGDDVNYGLILSGGKLFLTELDSRTPQNVYPISDDVKKF
ncbi:MAG: hypothetical protein AAB572_00255, partial [Patescibacteria group bacterium]